MVVLISAALSLSLPLATYTVSLAFFGLTHVLSELRYVDLRFSPTILPPFRLRLGVLLAGVVVLRVLSNLKVIPSSVEIPLELVLVALLCLSLWPMMKEGRAPALLLVGLLALGIGIDPLTTLLTLSVLHNLTPLGFLAEAVPSPYRRWVMVGAVLAFVGLPLLIATGWIQDWLVGQGITVNMLDPLGAGPLEKHRYVFVPPPISTLPWADHFFAGVVCAQCLHYFVVIQVLPRLLPQTPRVPPEVVMSWTEQFPLRVLAVSLLMIPLFFWNFTNARAFYGLAAAVHAWIELPVLLLVLDRGLLSLRGRSELAPLQN